MKVKLSQKGWVVIPAAMCEKYGLKPGTTLQLVDYGGVLAFVPIYIDPVIEGVGMLQGDDSLTQAILKEHRLERQRE